MPFVFILGLSSIVGFFAGARAFLDGEDFEAGKVVRKSVSACRNVNIQAGVRVCACHNRAFLQVLLMICYWAVGLWILQRARISSPRDRIRLMCGTVVMAGMLLLYSWADAEELLEYQTFWETEHAQDAGTATEKVIAATGARSFLTEAKDVDEHANMKDHAGNHGSIHVDENHDGVRSYDDEDHGVHAYPVRR